MFAKDENWLYEYVKMNLISQYRRNQSHQFKKDKDGRHRVEFNYVHIFCYQETLKK